MRHGPEHGSLQRDLVFIRENAAVLGNMLGGVHIVAGDHAHRDPGMLADAHRVWNLLTHLGSTGSNGAAQRFEGRVTLGFTNYLEM